MPGQTPSRVISRSGLVISSRPASVFSKQSVSPKGMTAKITSAGNSEMIGASAVQQLVRAGGTKSSLKANFSPSAAGWSRPAKRSPTVPEGMR